MSDRKSRMFSASGDSVKRTIVGGRPPARGGSMAGVPRGIEVLLRKAKVDSSFHDSFLADPVEAAKSIGLGLADSERAILSAVPASTLAAMVERIEVPEEHRSVFRGTAAAAMLSLVAATFAIGCSNPMVAPGGCVVRDDPVTEEEEAEEAGAKENAAPDKAIIIAGLMVEEPPGVKVSDDAPKVVFGLRVEDPPKELPETPDEPETPEESR